MGPITITLYINDDTDPSIFEHGPKQDMAPYNYDLMVDGFPETTLIAIEDGRVIFAAYERLTNAAIDALRSVEWIDAVTESIDGDLVADVDF